MLISNLKCKKHQCTFCGRLFCIVLPQICLFSPTMDMVIQTIQGMPQWQGWWCLFIIIYSSHICCLCFQPKSMTDIHYTSVHGNLTKATHPRQNTCFRQASMWFGPVTWLMAYWPVTWPLTHTFHTRFHMIWNSHPITDIHISHISMWFWPKSPDCNHTEFQSSQIWKPMEVLGDFTHQSHPSPTHLQQTRQKQKEPSSWSQLQWWQTYIRSSRLLPSWKAPLFFWVITAADWNSLPEAVVTILTGVLTKKNKKNKSCQAFLSVQCGCLSRTGSSKVF